jgi:hypothetical protein
MSLPQPCFSARFCLVLSFSCCQLLVNLLVSRLQERYIGRLRCTKNSPSRSRLVSYLYPPRQALRIAPLRCYCAHAIRILENFAARSLAANASSGWRAVRAWGRNRSNHAMFVLVVVHFRRSSAKRSEATCLPRSVLPFLAFAVACRRRRVAEFGGLMTAW